MYEYLLYSTVQCTVQVQYISSCLGIQVRGELVSHSTAWLFLGPDNRPTIYIYSIQDSLKGTVTRDFRAYIFGLKTLHLSLRIMKTVSRTLRFCKDIRLQSSKFSCPRSQQQRGHRVSLANGEIFRMWESSSAGTMRRNYADTRISRISSRNSKFRRIVLLVHKGPTSFVLNKKKVENLRTLSL